MIQLSWVIPCYNEAGRRADRLIANIGQIEAALAGLGLAHETIWVDDGSSDDTFAVLERATGAHASHRVLRHPINRGKGAALKTGFAAAAGAWMGFCDADLAIDLSILPGFIDSLRRGDDAAIASKWRQGASTDYSALRRGLSGLHLWAARRITGTDIVDLQCGMKVFNGSCKPILVGCRQNGWLWDTEAITRLVRNGARITEIPAVVKRAGTDRPSRLLSWPSLRDLTMDYVRLWRDLRR